MTRGKGKGIPDGARSVMDGNEAAASVAYRLNEVIAIYPITPSSAMGELADEWAARDQVNVWGKVPSVTEMQSEGGAAGAVHGALQAGALATTFTASQGLLLMIPNMYKIAGELTPFCIHVAARTIATHALSIFGDHSDVMACRQTGFALLASGSVQEAHDMACIAQAATFESRIPFLHFFDGFRTSHEVTRVSMLSDDALRSMIDEKYVRAHRERGLTPDRPVIRGTAQNPDTFFQAREACNGFYDACPSIVEGVMDRFARLTDRRYALFDYFGHPEADRVIVLMGSAGGAVRETVDWCNARGERTGVVVVRLYRPFASRALIEALPGSVRTIAVLDRTKEPGAPGEPLFLDVQSAVHEAARDGTFQSTAGPAVIGGRYGLSSKEFTPAMARSVLEEMKQPAPRRRFTLGIVDDVTHLSLDVDEDFALESEGNTRALFFGLGSDGTVGANKNSIKILGEETDLNVQGYFVYDSRKAGAVTVSHLRFGPEPIRSSCLIRSAGFTACHQFSFMDRIDVLESAAPGGTFLLNAPWGAGEVWDRLPVEAREAILEKKLAFWVIDADRVAREAGLGGRINTIMQTCFFALSKCMPRELAIERIKETIRETYGRKGAEVVRRNEAAVDAALHHLERVNLEGHAGGSHRRPPVVDDAAPDFVKRVTAVMMAGKGDLLPVSAFPVDGTWPSGTCRWEKRNIALQIPIWEPDICIQCNKCALVCPHAAIRAKVYPPGDLESAPESFLSRTWKGREFPDMRYTIQVAPEDCTGCNLCVTICPARDKANPRHKAINMLPQAEHRERERTRYGFFLSIPEVDRASLTRLDVKTSQLLQPLFEYSGACAGCGETPYIKLLTQLYGDRLLIANATGCSSIYGGNLPATPYTVNRDGRGPAWSNSLFEDNAEFGLGFRLALDSNADQARALVRRLASRLGDGLADAILTAAQGDEGGIRAQRERVVMLRERLAGREDTESRLLVLLADALVRKSVWLVGGDGWAFDIGFGGLDHVLSLNADVNILVLDTEVYSNTGGQASKATPLGAAAKFASKGKAMEKKDLGLMAMSYGHVYVASVAFGAKDAQTVRALHEADSYEGTSLIIAYSHCIAHGYDMAFGADQQARAVASGIWPLYRFDPRRVAAGEAPLTVDMPGGKIPVQEYMKNEARFRMVEKIDPERFREFAASAQRSAGRRMAIYEHLARLRRPEEDRQPDRPATPQKEVGAGEKT